MPRTRRPAVGPPWTLAFTHPVPPRTERVQLRPLGPPVAELDHAAIMESRERLRRELKWGEWPAEGFTLEDNRLDLARHLAELERREAFAYSVLDPSGQRCLGCVYLEPWEPGAQLAVWVIDDEVATGLEEHLLQTVAAWVRAAWPLDRLIVPLRATNTRGRAVVAAMGLPACDGPPDHVSFVLFVR